MHFPLSYHARDSGAGAGRQKQPPQPPQQQMPKQQQQQQQQQQAAGRSHGRHHSHGGGRSSKKSQPFDPDDLRRRLYVVLAEQEASKNRKRHARQESAARAQERQQQQQQQQLKTTQQPPESQRDSYWEEQQQVDEEKGSAGITKEGCAAEARTKADGAGNGDEKNRNARDGKTSGPVPTTAAAAPYRHVPQTAASQFVQTTTTATTTDTAPAPADGADKNKKRRMHALSYSALRRGELSEKEMEGGVLVRETPVAVPVSAPRPKSKSKSRPKSSGALRKLRSQHQEQDQLYETNSNHQVPPCETNHHHGNKTDAAAAATKAQDSLSIPVQDQFRDQGQHQKRYTVCGGTAGSELSGGAAARRTTTALGVGAEEYSTDEDCYTPGAGGGLHLTTAAHGQQRRKVDWTQSDEAHGHEHMDGKSGGRDQHRHHEGKGRSAFASGLRGNGPALHRVESIWTLKAKLGSLIRHNSNTGSQYRHNSKDEEGRPPAVQEVDEITPPLSSGSPTSPKSPRRLAFLARFRR